MQAAFPINRMACAEDAGDSRIFNVVIVYDDVPAGQRAMRVLNNLALGFERRFVEMRPQLWRFDWLGDPEWFALALADAVNADMLVVSTSSASGLPAPVEGWLKLCLARKRGTSAAVVALLGPAGTPDDPASPRLQFVQGMARNAGLDFFTPQTSSLICPSNPSRTGGTQFCDRQPYQRWGLNE